MRTKEFKSPWIEELSGKRFEKIKDNYECDILVLGAGISGVLSAYYQLKDTENSVILIESKKFARGASGHNAGQLASYFEIPFSHLSKKYGFEIASRTQRGILLGWDLIDHIVLEADIKTKPETFAGFEGCTRVEQILVLLEDAYERNRGYMNIEFGYILDDEKILSKIPRKYKNLFSKVPLENIQKKLETDSSEFIAVFTVRKGCMNSAKFCEEILVYLSKNYKERFKIFENSPVEEIIAGSRSVKSKSLGFEIESKKIILCTNGFPINVKNKVGDEKCIYDNLVSGLVGYMAGYTEKAGRRFTAISYLEKDFSHKMDESYIYLTRRGRSNSRSLVCIGGPDRFLDEKEVYKPEIKYLEKYKNKIPNFLLRYHKFSGKKKSFEYEWEGLMGYTRKGLRIVGADPFNKRIWYNLGCNGVGILPAVYGAKRISLLFQGRKLKPTLFDPENHL